MKFDAFYEECRRAHEQCRADRHAIEAAARRVEMAGFLDEGEEDAGEPASAGGWFGHGGVSAALADDLRAGRDVIAAARERRRLLWEACASVLATIEHSLDDDLFALIPRFAAHDYESEASDAVAETQGAAADSFAGTAAPNPDDAAAEAEAEADEWLAKCRRRLFEMRGRSRWGSSSGQGRTSSEGRVFKFGKPRPLERPDGE